MKTSSGGVNSSLFKSRSSGVGFRYNVKVLKIHIMEKHLKIFSQKPFSQKCWNLRRSILMYSVNSFVQILILWGRVGPTKGPGSKLDIGLFKIFLGNRMPICDIISSCNKGSIVFDMRIFGESFENILYKIYSTTLSRYVV